MSVFLHNHSPNLLNLNPIQLHRNRLSLNAQIPLKIWSNIIKQLMIDGLRDGHTFIGVELQRSLQKIINLRSKKLEQLTKRLAFNNTKRFDVVLSSLIGNEVDVGRCANGGEDDGAE